MEYTKRVEIIKNVWGDRSDEAIKFLDCIYAHDKKRISPMILLTVFGEGEQETGKSLDMIRYFCGSVQRLLKQKFFLDKYEGPKGLVELDPQVAVDAINSNDSQIDGFPIVISYEITK